MAAAPLLIPPQKDLVVGVQEEEPEGVALLPEAAEGAGKVREHFAATGVHHHGHTLGVSLGGPAQLGEFLQHLGRDIIHAEVSQILQGIDDFGFPCTGKAGDNN